MVPEDSPLSRLVGKLQAEALSPSRGPRGQWRSRCPTHDDRFASLSLGQGKDGRALVTCHAGCQTRDVVAALGLKMSDLFPSEVGPCEPPQPHGSRGGRRPEPVEPDVFDKTFGAVSPAIICYACPVCEKLYAYLAWRCGKNNKPQRRMAVVAEAIGVQERTAATHAVHLAETGWISYQANTTASGAHRAASLSLRHCPALGLVNPDVRRPDRGHGVTGGTVARSTRYARPTEPAMES